MWAREVVIAQEAASTLAAIGGRGEMIAIDLWLRHAKPEVTEDDKRHMRECRGRIQARLK